MESRLLEIHRKSEILSDWRHQILDVSNLAFTDHLEGNKRQSSIYVTHQTNLDSLKSILDEEGLLMDPLECLNKPDRFICPEIFTHPLLGKERLGHHFEDRVLADDRINTAIQRRRRLNTVAEQRLDQRVRGIRNKIDWQKVTNDYSNLYNVAVVKRKHVKSDKFDPTLDSNILLERSLPDILELIEDDFPEFYKLLREKLKFLSEAYPDIFSYTDYGSDFLWQRKTVGELIPNERLREVEQTVKQVISELKWEYEHNVYPQLHDDLKNWTLFNLRAQSDERKYIDHQLGPIWGRIHMLLANGGRSQPTYYESEFQGITLILELNEEMIDIEQARKGNFSTKSVVVDNQGSFVITPSFVNKDQKHILPLRFIKGIMLTHSDKTTNEAYLKKIKQTFQAHPDLILPVYDEHGNIIWPEFISHDDVKRLKTKQTTH